MTSPRPHSLLTVDQGVAPSLLPLTPKAQPAGPGCLSASPWKALRISASPPALTVSASFQIRLPAKRLPSRTCTQTPPSATSRAATPSMSSWALAWPGPWPPSTGPCRDRSTLNWRRCPRAFLGRGMTLQGQPFPPFDEEGGSIMGGEAGRKRQPASSRSRPPHVSGSWRCCLEPGKESPPRGWLQGLLNTRPSGLGKD